MLTFREFFKERRIKSFGREWKNENNRDLDYRKKFVAYLDKKCVTIDENIPKISSWQKN